MVEFVTGPPRPNFAETTHPRAFRELVLLGGIEMEETHDHEATVILQGHLQASAPAHHQIGFHHLAFDHPDVANAQVAHGDNACAILVSMGKMEQQILQRTDAQLRQLVGQGITDALQGGNGNVVQ